MAYIRHDFTGTIIAILQSRFNGEAENILEASELLKYLNVKTRAANRGSKSRAGYANHYAIYVLVEDYINGGFHRSGNYSTYAGAKFTNLFRRQRELPFGSKLQNHALNSRLNEEFKGYFPTSEHRPIIRDVESNRYWINEHLLTIEVGGRKYNIAEVVKEIIDAYVGARQSAFNEFMAYCEQMIAIQDKDSSQAIEFIRGLLRPNVDARVFEIVSYAVLKEHYADQLIYWGWSLDEINPENLVLYKTGRTNANDGGIDFVMKPLGRFFQVTETVDAGKYFLDIDKVQRYPITFVVKSEEPSERIKERIEEQARARYPVEAVVKRYLDSIEEIINIPNIMTRYDNVLSSSRGDNVIKEIVLQSRVEFNVQAEDEETLVYDKVVSEQQDEGEL